jgi:adenylate kinase
MRIVLLGPPGSGKADLSAKIAEHYGMPVITVGSVMERAAAEPSELGRLAKEAMEQSRVSDELLLALLRIQIPQMDLSHGFLLVDFPKNAGQADVLDNMLGDLGAAVELVLNLQVDPDELMERLVGRIACDHCGAQYNLYVNPPMVDGVCDACGARVVRRPDDYEETISNRLRVYEGQMGPLLQYYQLNDKLKRIEADQGVDQAWKAVQKVIKALPPSVPPVPPAKPQLAADQVSTANKGAKKVVAKKAQVKTKSASKPATAQPKAASKTAAKKTAAKKAPVKKSAAKKVAAKKAPAKKTTVAKKTVAKKAAAKKKVVKKAAAKKSAVKKAPAAKKSMAKKKVGTKKPATKKALAKKTVAKKTAAKKAASKKKVVAKKLASKKVVAKKVAAKKPASKRVPAKKAVAKKAAAKQRPVAANKKASSKKKASAKKKSRR